MIRHLSVLGLPCWKYEIGTLIGHAEAVRAVRELCLPPLLYGNAESLPVAVLHNRILNPLSSSARFSVLPFLNISLGEKFFRYDSALQLFILIHELRHAYQYLIDEVWQQYGQRRKNFAMRNQVESQEQVMLFLSAPREFDANMYALSRLPKAGSEIVLKESRKIIADIKSHPSDRARTLYVCMDILPALYEWRRMVERRLLLPEYEDELSRNNQLLVDFLHSHTLVGSDAATSAFCRGYLEADPSDFLEVAEAFYAHLVKLPL